MATLSQNDIKTLEQTRQRLSQLTNSLASLQQAILQSDPLPPISSLQTQTSILSTNLTSLTTHLTTSASLLSSLAVFPLPNFPGKEQETLLNQLLRKKLEPGVEEWVEEGRRGGENTLARGSGRGGFHVDSGGGEEGRRRRRNEINELWEWAGMAANEEARGHEWGGELDDEDDDNDGDDNEGLDGQEKEGGGHIPSQGDVEMGGQKGDGIEEESTGKAPLPMEDVLRFLMTGTVTHR